MTILGSQAVVADAVGMLLVGVMWAISLAVMAGIAFLLGKWLRNREERRKRPANPDGALSRSALRSVKRAKRRQDNASDLDGYL